MAGDQEESVLSRLAGGAFYRCDEKGLRLLSESGALTECLGRSEEELRQGLGAILSKAAPEEYRRLFDPLAQDPQEGLIPYEHPSLGRRWLFVRHSPSPEGGRIAFLRDDTFLQESLRKMATSQSKDVENSARLQAAVLMEGPRFSTSTIEYQTTTIPSKLVDGDFLDVLRLSPDSVDLLLGDVMGKGMDAAIQGTMIKFAVIRSLTRSLYGVGRLPDPAEICVAAEAAVATRLLDRQSFATLTYARYDEVSQVLAFVDCGHTSIIRHSPSTGKTWRVKGGNMPLGFTAKQAYRNYLLPLDEGDLILMFTDGLSECGNRWGQTMGEERIMYMLATYSELPAADLTGKIMKLGFEFSSSGFNDDVSLICMRVKGRRATAEPSSRLEVPLGDAGFKALEGAEEAFAADLAAWRGSLAGEEKAKLVLALHEALTNILKHAKAGQEGQVGLGWRLRGDLLVLELDYVGPDYDWAKRPNLPLASFAESGYGRFILDEAMDSLLVAQGHHGAKRLVICKDLGPREGT